MAFSWTSLQVTFIFHLFGVHAICVIHAQSFSPPPGFELPEIDGSAVVDTCRIVFASTSEPTAFTATAGTTASPVTREQVVPTTKTPATQLLPRKPATKSPIRPKPAAGRPIPAGQSNPALSLLYNLWAQSRARVAQPIGGYRAGSSSDESPEIWRKGAFSSEESSDES